MMVNAHNLGRQIESLQTQVLTDPALIVGLNLRVMYHDACNIGTTFSASVGGKICP